MYRATINFYDSAALIGAATYAGRPVASLGSDCAAVYEQLATTTADARTACSCGKLASTVGLRMDVERATFDATLCIERLAVADDEVHRAFC